MSATSTLPTDGIHGMPTGLLQAANKGDTAAMLALVDFLRERDLPAQELESDPMPSDQELAFGFLRLAHECETSALDLQHLDQLLIFLGRPTRQPFPKQHLVTASEARAKRIRDYLQQVGIGLPVIPGDRFRKLPPGQHDHGAYTVLIPWTGQDQTVVTRALLGHLTAAFPGVRFVTATHTGIRDPEVETAFWCARESAALTTGSLASQ